MESMFNQNHTSYGNYTHLDLFLREKYSVSKIFYVHIIVYNLVTQPVAMVSNLGYYLSTMVMDKTFTLQYFTY